VPPDPTNRCTLCDRLVLGLAGQDWTVLPWMLAGEGDIPPGPCHARCLDESGAAGSWAEAVEAYHCHRWPRWLSGSDAGIRWRLHSSRPARRFHLWRSDGRLLSFPYAAALRPGPLLLATELAELGSAHAAALLAAMGTDEPGVEVPLSAVIAALGLADRYPDGTGSVTRRLRVVGADATDVLEVRHPLPLAPACRHAARELLR
jgi:hypothetical protein